MIEINNWKILFLTKILYENIIHSKNETLITIEKYGLPEYIITSDNYVKYSILKTNDTFKYNLAIYNKETKQLQYGIKNKEDHDKTVFFRSNRKISVRKYKNGDEIFYNK